MDLNRIQREIGFLRPKALGQRRTSFERRRASATGRATQPRNLISIGDGDAERAASLRLQAGSGLCASCFLPGIAWSPPTGTLRAQRPLRHRDAPVSQMRFAKPRLSRRGIPATGEISIAPSKISTRVERNSDRSDEVKLVELPTCQQLIVQHEMLQEWSRKPEKTSMTGRVLSWQVRLPDVTAFHGTLDLKSRFPTGSPQSKARCFGPLPSFRARAVPLPVLSLLKRASSSGIGKIRERDVEYM